MFEEGFEFKPELPPSEDPVENASMNAFSFVKKAVELHAHRLLDGQHGRTIFKFPS